MPTLPVTIPVANPKNKADALARIQARTNAKVLELDEKILELDDAFIAEQMAENEFLFWKARRMEEKEQLQASFEKAKAKLGV
jgi:hypothetical protein